MRPLRENGLPDRGAQVPRQGILRFFLHLLRNFGKFFYVFSYLHINYFIISRNNCFNRMQSVIKFEWDKIRIYLI